MTSAFGVLYIVATPIGNLQDVSFRAIEFLKKVALIISEDTRETAKLLSAHQISTPQISYTDQKHDRIISDLLERLTSGNDIALVSDNGTPTISDPGFRLVRECKNRGIKVESIPGPSAVIAALSVSGLPTDKFVYLGFLPKKKAEIVKTLEKYTELEATLIMYESPYRINKLISIIYELVGNRVICIAKDLTKHFEFVKTDYLENLLAEKQLEKGEYVVLISKKGYIL